MIPEFETIDFIILLFSISFLLLVFVPCLPAIVIAYRKKYDIKKKIKFAMISCLFAYGMVSIFCFCLAAPFLLINTYLTPKWQTMGYKEFAYFFKGFDSAILEVLIIPLIVVASIVTPFKLAKYWQIYENTSANKTLHGIGVKPTPPHEL